MNSRTRPMAIDGHSVEADLQLTPEVKAQVEVVVLDILRVAGPCTDDVITALYQSRAEHYPGVPHVTPQRVRTARASLARKSLVTASTTPGVSALGNPATIWQLTLPKEIAA